MEFSKKKIGEQRFGYITTQICENTFYKVKQNREIERKKEALFSYLLEEIKGYQSEIVNNSFFSCLKNGFKFLPFTDAEANKYKTQVCPVRDSNIAKQNTENGIGRKPARRKIKGSTDQEYTITEFEKLPFEPLISADNPAFKSKYAHIIKGIRSRLKKKKR